MKKALITLLAVLALATPVFAQDYNGTQQPAGATMAAMEAGRITPQQRSDYMELNTKVGMRRFMAQQQVAGILDQAKERQLQLIVLQQIIASQNGR